MCRMEDRVVLTERVIDTLDARELLDKNVKSSVETLEFYTRRDSYDLQLKSIKFDGNAMLW